MILYIAEKASVGRALASVLPGEKKKEENHILCGADAVAWASGHLLALYEPDEYDEKYKRWNLDSLPIVPGSWKMKEIGRTKDLLKNLARLIRGASEVVHTGDADREGQLLVDEILEYAGWKGPTKRLRLNDVNPDAIRKALKDMKDNGLYRGESLAGRARSYADWLVGMNLTRHCTIHASNAGYEAIFSVGRVQTPTLGLVVKRDREIENFVSKPFYVLTAALRFSAGSEIVGCWQPGEDAAGLDSEGRLVDGEVRDMLKTKLTNALGTVSNVEEKPRAEAPPLPYNLAQLQIDASKKYDITDTLQYAQKLYEQGYITYPRSGCRYIPEGHFADAARIVETIAVACPNLPMRDMLNALDVTHRNEAWDDEKVTEHHAVIPTAKVPLPDALSESERKIYELVAARYLLQFFPDHQYIETKVEFNAAGECFKATGRKVLVPGWKNVSQETDGIRNTDDEPEADEERNETFPFPAAAEGDSGQVMPRVEETQTRTPARFTYGGLLAAMNGIHAYVEDPAIRKQLKELDGIGTSATQENTIKLLFDRGFIEKKKKQLFSTSLGRALIDLMASGKGAVLVKPDLTAQWERKMTLIENGELDLEIFLREVGGMVQEIVKAALDVSEIRDVPKKKKCPVAECEGFLRRVEGKNGVFLACPICGNTFNVSPDGEPIAKKTAPDGEAVEADCPLGCGKKARRFKGMYGYFWKCRCSPNEIFADRDGKPAVKEKRPQFPCPVKGCKGTAVQLAAKTGGRLFWKCEKCRNFFDDKDGKPVIRKKQEK
jgi:DNA topoisomerase-3